MHNHTQAWIRHFRTALVTEIKALLPGLVSQAYNLSYSAEACLSNLVKPCFKTKPENRIVAIALQGRACLVCIRPWNQLPGLPRREERRLCSHEVVSPVPNSSHGYQITAIKHLPQCNYSTV